VAAPKLGEGGLLNESEQSFDGYGGEGRTLRAGIVE